MKHVVYFVTEDWYFCSHRLHLARAAIAAGYRVTVVTRVRRHGQPIIDAGCQLVPFELSRRSINPFAVLSILFRLILIYQRLAPDIVHHVALKPVLVGTLAARWCSVPKVVNALGGLGFLFSSSRLKARLLKPLVVFGLRRLMGGSRVSVIVQNADDRALLLGSRVVTPSQLVVIKGAGVDTDLFAPADTPAEPVVVILAARLLWDKGVGEFVEASRLLRSRGASVRMVVVGEGDEENPASIPSDQIARWKSDSPVEWWGFKESMASVLAGAHIVCLPSYREGLPKVLLEAASMALPIVTTDVPGCREVVQHGVNGVLVPKGEAAPLADAIEKLAADPDLRAQMGLRGRSLVLGLYSESTVASQTLSLYSDAQRTSA